MHDKYTFWTLCAQYDKIEIPIIQRDYAQGRGSTEVERIRKSFVDEYLLAALLQGIPNELDFVYGSVLGDEKNKIGKRFFVPLDGQQRLTTLFLLHWFIALKEDKVEKAWPVLSKFTYETRPSAHDFCALLIQKKKFASLSDLRQEILDAEWYDDEWHNDPTVKGMVTMIDTFARNKQLIEHPDGLFDALTGEGEPLISFYFIPLEKFGLTENLYIRMNARGKELTPFEHFKSEFYNIIAYQPVLLERVKDQIEYQWVDNLWNYKEPDSFVIDKPFMRYLRFISEMLYFKDAQFRADSYETDFLDLTLLRTIYAKEENLKFLIFALDQTPLLESFDKQDLLWEPNSAIKNILRSIVDGPADTLRSIILYVTIRYFFLQRPAEHYPDFIRVVRNLLENTVDKSVREWPRLFASLDKLITNKNVYQLLLEQQVADQLDGFYVPQRREETLKSKIMSSFPEAKKLFAEIEDNDKLRGNITMLIAANYVSTTLSLETFDPLTADEAAFSTKKLISLYKSYKIISQQDFNLVWGDLLASPLYENSLSRVMYDLRYPKNSAVIELALAHTKWSANTELEDFLRDKERKFIRQLAKKHPDLAAIRNVQKQLYLYYILHRRIMKLGMNTFFSNGYNFGWLKKEKGFMSIFTHGIEKDPGYAILNPIFQTYKSQFRYSFGLKTESALPPEVVKAGRKRNPFELLIEWAGE